MPYTRDEIQAAFDRYRDAAANAARTGDWAPWVECFTPDARYVEHLYGEFHGRDEILAWIEKTMTVFPFDHMNAFPWDWYTIDADNGWVVGQVANRFADPGDGETYESANWTRLVYAGDGRFCEEEDVYNPSRFAPMVDAWLSAWARHHPDRPRG